MFSAESHEDFFSSSSSCGSAPGAGICSGHIPTSTTGGRTGYKPLLQQHPAGTQGCCALPGDELLLMSCPLLLFASTIQSMHKNEASGEGTEPRELIALNAAHCKHLQQNPSHLTQLCVLHNYLFAFRHPAHIRAPRLVSGSSHPRDLEGCLRTGHKGQNRPTLLRRQLTLPAAIYR